MWSTLAPTTALSGSLPPFLFLGLSFTVAFIVGSGWLIVTRPGNYFRAFRQPRGFWLMATGALFVYHALYFIALKSAPAAEANLLNYLWPLLIVLLSSLAQGEGRLAPRQVAGALMGLLATVLLLLNRGLGGLSGDYLWGYLAGIGAAVIWASYSVSNRRYARVPTEAMVGICGLTAVLGFLASLIIEPGAPMPKGMQWIAVAIAGIGPVGLSFFVWDYGTKHGSLATLGTLAYATPVLSTILLVVIGAAEPGLALFAACALVVGGAWLATARKGPKPSADGGVNSPYDADGAKREGGA